jgi:choline dehydrogenase-like flavoprotein
MASEDAKPQGDYEYVVVGSGAGGGTVAARLAEWGHRVLLLEAGGDPRTLQGGDAIQPDVNRLPDDYDVPLFHAIASENKAMKWDFFVKHYKDPATSKLDDKYYETYDDKKVDGVLYPRAGTLGGCTAHNAQITVYPHNKDWEYIRDLMKDPSWAPKKMRKYFQRMENCHHRRFWRWVYNLTRINPTRHGFRGWLHTQVAIPKAAIKDKKIKWFFIETVAALLNDGDPGLLQRIRWFVLGKGDPNDWRLVGGNSTGLRFPPLATNNHQRNGSRERVLAVAGKPGSTLTIELDALATRIILDKDKRAIGVEYLKGAHLYRASATPNPAPGEKRTVLVTREVILAGGAYNTPQLLMLSGIGPRDHLEEKKIKVQVELAGVGSNLQDRYEVGVVNRMKFKQWGVLKDAKFSPGDPQYGQWDTKRDGVYITNGAVAAIVRKSVESRPLPDLFVVAFLGLFKGYFPGYSKLFADNLNYLTWVVLKAHTHNCAGTVRLRSTNPLDTPEIDFCYFTDGNDTTGEDLQSVIEGIRFARTLTELLRAEGVIEKEELPGEEKISDKDLGDFVKDNAWGHHASCSCPIGEREKGGVVNSDFEVHGTKGLRIVDASVFPKIPGFFIVTSVYMIGEKAADVIHAASKQTAPNVPVMPNSGLVD